MSDSTDDVQGRAHGIDFGPLAQQLEGHEYPATSDELVEAYGDTVLGLQNGEQTLREVFDSHTETFTSPRQARQAIFAAVDEQAIGRKAYSDRTPPGPGEETEHDEESF